MPIIHGGRPPLVEHFRLREVERMHAEAALWGRAHLAWLGNYRHVVVRSDRHVRTDLGLVAVACILTPRLLLTSGA